MKVQCAEVRFLEEILSKISWYNGYDFILKSLLEGLEKDPATSVCPCKYDQIIKDHNSEEYYVAQIIWMLLVDLFGNYGTSPRFGWIEDIEDCKEFLQYIINLNTED